jgi:NAD-dependent DNA ligase
MASEQVARILRSRGAPFTSEQVTSMSDADGWAWITAFDKAKSEAKPKSPEQPQVCFTGFVVTDKDRLAAMAENCGYQVKDSVTKNLALLVTGPEPGPSKLNKARQQGCPVTDEAGFLELICAANIERPPLR